jgi:RNA polymerase sigma factor (sigma-70 family)
MDLNDTLDVTPLVQAAVAGDPVAWDRLVDRYSPLVRSVVWSFRLPHKDAEDANQMVWLALVQHLGRLREPRALPGWIVTTTRRECLSLLQSTRRSVPIDVSESHSAMWATESCPEDDYWQAERRCALWRGLAELPDRQRELMELLLADPPLSYDEISARLGIPRGSIGPTRARAMRRLQATLRAYDDTYAEAS